MNATQRSTLDGMEILTRRRRKKELPKKKAYSIDSYSSFIVFPTPTRRWPETSILLTFFFLYLLNRPLSIWHGRIYSLTEFPLHIIIIISTGRVSSTGHTILVVETRGQHAFNFDADDSCLLFITWGNVKLFDEALFSLLVPPWDSFSLFSLSEMKRNVTGNLIRRVCIYVDMQLF